MKNRKNEKMKNRDRKNENEKIEIEKMKKEILPSIFIDIFQRY